MNKYLRLPDETINLHGYTTAEAGHILRELFERGESLHVRIIVGKGSHGTNGPVIRDYVKTYLASRNVRFSQSKLGDGGEGALEVYL